jgi:hypothetical protein
MTDLSNSKIQAMDEEFARAITFRDSQYKAGFADLMAHDCSGFLSWLMRETGIWDDRKNCDGLWAMCDVVARNELIAGDFLFQRAGLFAPRFLVGLGRDGIRPGAFLRQDIPENILGLCAQLFHDRGLAARWTQLEHGGEVLTCHAQQQTRELRARFESIRLFIPDSAPPFMQFYPTSKNRRRVYCCAQ